MNLQYFRNLTTVFILVQSLLFSQESSSLKNHELEFIYFEPSLAFTTNYSGALKLTHMHILGIQLEDSEDFIRTDKLYGGYFDNSMINAMEINGADIAKFYNKIDKSFFSSKLSKTFSNLSLCKYRDTNYVFLDDVIITDIYNSDRMSKEVDPIPWTVFLES